MSKKKAKKGQKKAKTSLPVNTTVGDDMDKLFEDGGKSIAAKDTVVPMSKVMETIDAKKRTSTRPVVGKKAPKKPVEMTPKVKPTNPLYIGPIEEASINADWDKIGTVPELEKALIGFKFNGPGWYNFRKDTVLVVSTERPMDKWWGQHAQEGEVFRVYVFNNNADMTHPATIYGSIATAPTRTM